ncbi:GIY-YIG nuclease family protein [Agrilactobacillus fermenti]|uniref:GIY-YIG nuclease family protein n=1 Tax=Agrilactobacillus fermenti TaxID=2586909 RepID=UPI001E60A017|nr:GIY-YIG nuclease family protein [Agrilactobacillus fermenti]MCD2256248.1 GIY-YIG nuclease family protein [Agrilactobacillus fermenti]
MVNDVHTVSNYYVYILKCADNTLYTGYTTDVTHRVAMHNAGKGAKYTRARRPVKLLYYWQLSTKSEALKAEAHFKKLTRTQKLRFLRAHNILI